MPKKARESARQRVRGRGKIRGDNKLWNPTGVSVDRPRYGCLYPLNKLVGIVFGKWHARNLRCVSPICRDLPTIVEEDSPVGDEDTIMGTLHDLKQWAGHKPHFCRSLSMDFTQRMQKRVDTVMSMFEANVKQNQAIMALLTQQGKSIEALATRLDLLEGNRLSSRSKDTTPILVDDDDEPQFGRTVQGSS
ncbi:hypothetical protein PIB30_058822 [Stylosanthes scabra]|uniref:Uncharacterized protein n=1 Tax=Stylosanthes scabra TaxID=79078 RepID=A0ABU6SK57_9FABA|nr:hypothetical protein [Stylosanthes scabra]